MQIGGVELSESDVAWLEREGRSRTRTDIARRLCERISLIDGTGRARVVTARIDISRHVGAGRLKLPKSKSPFRRTKRRPRDVGVRPERVSGRRRKLSDLLDLRVHRIDGPRDRWHSEWTKNLDEHHYLGSGPLCGAQIRYVVLTAKDELVAAASFSSAALKVKARDQYIGWTTAARRQNRHLVIAQSRFCITVDVSNLASRVQSMLLERVANDWSEAYGIRPLLVETFVDTRRFSGTCYKASNWTMVGKTAGRGRQDQEHRAAAGIKDVWIFPLDAKWRDALTLEPVRKLNHDRDWAEIEWGGVDLGDSRLSKRLVEYGRSRFNRPTANLPQSCGSPAATKAAYRLLNNPKSELDRLLSEHRETTLARAAEHPIVLAIQDTTSLNYTMHPSTEGLGPIGSFGANETKGLEVHSLMLADPSGTPLGLLDVNAWARPKDGYGESDERWRLPTAEKESQKWLRGYAAADRAARRAKKTKFVVVGDREADMFDLLHAAVNGHADLLVRAVHPRRIEVPDGETKSHLWDAVRRDPVIGEMIVQVPRRGTRPARTATMQLRSREVRIPRPNQRSRKGDFVNIWAIAATEVPSAETDAEPLEWLLLTTLPAKTFEEIAEKVRWYFRRWLIEVFHRTLKSGCKIENRQSSTASGLLAALAVDVVVAWRVMALTKLGRETPDVPCSIYFEEIEWKALHCFIHKTKHPPTSPPSMRDAMRMVGSLGGFLGRKCDGEPGAQTVWRGLERLTDIAAVFAFFFSSA